MRCVSGLIYEYYFICKRKTWLCMHGVSLEDDNSNVQIGKLIDENSYERERKHILIDDTANIDFLKDKTVYEVKKSKAEKKAAISQIKYYLYVLKKKGVICSGELRVPKENYSEKVEIIENDEIEIENNIKSIFKECGESNIPPTINKSLCKKCAFYELCYI